jgi:hypothetical protein
VSRVRRSKILRSMQLAGIAMCMLVTARQSFAQRAPTRSVTMPWIAKSGQSNGFYVQLPATLAGSLQTGLHIEVDSRWIDSFGYRPIQVAVTSSKPTTVNHLVTIRLYVASTDIVSVEQDFEMPAGSVEAHTTIACPQYHNQLSYWWDVWIDGVKDPALSTESTVGLQVDTWNPGGTLKFLVLGATARAYQTTSAGVGTFDTLTLSVIDLPKRWLDYTCFDVAALKPGEMRSIAQSRPEALTAICRWVRSGGQLWVSPVGAQWEELSDVETLLGLAATGLSESATGQEADPSKVDALPHEETRGTPLADDVVLSHGWKPLKVALTTQSTSDTPAATEVAATAKDLPVDSMASYVQQAMGLGYVRLYRKAWDPSGVAWSMQMLSATTPPNESPPAATPLSVAMATTRSWDSRHGMAPNAANTDFANLLVPGVGLAPVTEFRILITLFALAIGPVNYWLLKRWNRPHLMVLTVPIMAALVTLTLFSYALLSDGFSTLVRVRSFTSLDQRTGEAACWARLSYYAGLAPAHGLTLPDDVAVYPILPGWNETSSRGSAERMRQIEWADGENRLTQGWLRSRTPTQYLMLRARKTESRLELTPGAGKVAAKNQLGTAISYVAAIDDEGNFFTGEGLAESATQNLAPTTWADVAAKLRTIVSDNLLVTPPELTDETSSFANTQRRQRRQFFRSQLGLDYSAERLDDNLMSGAITSLAGTSSEAPLELPPRSYVAITQTGPEVATGIPGAVEDSSFHVVVGKW